MAERFAIMCAAPNDPSPARVAHALTRNGAEVCVVAPPESYAALTRYKVADLVMTFEEMVPCMPHIARTLAEEFGAHSVLCGDDATFSAWTHLLRRADDAKLSEKTRAMIARSLPPLEKAALIDDGAAFITSQAGTFCGPPPSLGNPSEAEALKFAAEVGYPVMLKRNAYAAGRGVTRCGNPIALSVALSDGRANPRDPGFVVQKHVAGDGYAVAIGGVTGKPTAAFSFIKYLKMGGANGQASVLRYARNDDLLLHAAQLYAALELNGFAGLDYIVDASGRPWLLEVNQGIVPKSHFSECFGVDLAASMLALLRGTPIPEPRAPVAEYVALFPNEWLRDPRSPYLHNGFHDVPWEDPGVLAAMIQNTIERRDPQNWYAHKS
jgi:biotin carboxylase